MNQSSDFHAWRGGLTSVDVERIHEMSLELISTVGFKLTDPESQDLCKKAGGKVDEIRGTVTLPPEVIKWALDQCPHTFTRYSIDGEPYDLQPDRLYQCTATHRTKLLDFGSEATRRATCRDLERFAIVADALPGIISVSPMLTPVDAPDGLIELTELETILLNTGKHIYNATASVEETRWTLDLVEMLSSEPLSKQHTLTIRACAATPLVLADDVAQVILTSARRGAILAIGSAAASGTTAPPTLAGTILLQNVEYLFPMALAQLASPGAAVDYQVACTIADLRTGWIMYGATEMPLLTAGLKAMAEFYGVPFSANQSTDATTLDIANGLEKMMHFAHKMSIGINFLRNAGDLNKASTMSLEQMWIDHEIARMLHRYWSGIQVDDEKLAMEAIREVGPGGTFLTHPLSLKHARSGEHFIAPILYKGGTSKPTLLDWAHSQVETILKSHKYQPTDAKVDLVRSYISKEGKRLAHA